MKRNIGIAKTAWVCTLGLLVGCASMTASVESADDSLRDTDLDVLFATEFPVASEAEALSKAADAMRAGEVDRALFFYVRGLQFNPENVDLLARIGDIHMGRSSFSMAKRAYVQARKIDQEHARSLEALGLIYMAEGNDEEAIAELTSATAKDEKRWRAHNALGIYLDKSGDFHGAQVHYDSALAQRPDAGYVLNNRGYSKFLAGDFSGATIDLYIAAHDRGFDQAWGNLGMVYASQGLYEEAVSAYREIMSEANAYGNTGQVALENGDLADARHFLDEAIRRSPTYFPEAERNLELLEKLY